MKRALIAGGIVLLLALVVTTVQKPQSSPSPISPSSTEETTEQSETSQENSSGAQEAESADITLSDDGFGDIITDIVTNEQRETFAGQETQEIITGDGTFIFDTPEKFFQAVDPDDQIVGFYLSNKPGIPNEHVILMLVQPARIGPKGYGLFTLTLSAKNLILKDQLKLGTNYQFTDKIKTENWQGFRRGVVAYEFDSRLPVAHSRGLDYFIFRNDTSADGLWVHIQIPQEAWDDVFPLMSASLETLRTQE